MIRLLVPHDLAAGAELALDEGRSRYVGAVMRLSVGDELLVFNGRDGAWPARGARARGAGAARGGRAGGSRSATSCWCSTAATASGWRGWRRSPSGRGR